MWGGEVYHLLVTADAKDCPLYNFLHSFSFKYISFLVKWILWKFFIHLFFILYTTYFFLVKLPTEVTFPPVWLNLFIIFFGWSNFNSRIGDPIIFLVILKKDILISIQKQLFLSKILSGLSADHCLLILCNVWQVFISWIHSFH